MNEAASDLRPVGCAFPSGAATTARLPMRVVVMFDDVQPVTATSQPKRPIGQYGL